MVLSKHKGLFFCRAIGKLRLKRNRSNNTHRSSGKFCKLLWRQLKLSALVLKRHKCLQNVRWVRLALCTQVYAFRSINLVERCPVIKLRQFKLIGVVMFFSPPQAIRYGALAFLNNFWLFFILLFEFVNCFSSISKLPRLFTKVSFKFSRRSFEFSFYKLSDYTNVACDF